MKLTFIYLFIPLFLLLLSCQKSNKEISNVQEIDCSFDESMTIKLSEITDSIEIVPLETKEESFIGMACQIKTYNRKYYIGNPEGECRKIGTAPGPFFAAFFQLISIRLLGIDNFCASLVYFSQNKYPNSFCTGICSDFFCLPQFLDKLFCLRGKSCFLAAASFKHRGIGNWNILQK